MNRKFVKVPKMWQVRLGEIQANGSTYRVALYLLDRATWGEQVPLGNRVLEKHGVNRRAKWRALETLRQAGLVAVEHRPRRNPIVRVRWTRSRWKVIRVIRGDPFWARVAASTSLSGGGSDGSRTGSYDC
jgi:hypothetical protein